MSDCASYSLIRSKAAFASISFRDFVLTRRSNIVGTMDMDVALAVTWIRGKRGWWKTRGTRKLLTCPFSYVPDVGASSRNAWPLFKNVSRIMSSPRAFLFQSHVTLTGLQLKQPMSHSLSSFLPADSKFLPTMCQRSGLYSSTSSYPCVSRRGHRLQNTAPSEIPAEYPTDGECYW